jgi:hypothetical protein
VDGVNRLGEIVLDEKKTLETVRLLANCAGPTHTLPPDVEAKLVSDLFNSLRRHLEEAASSIVEREVYRAYDALHPRPPQERRGRKRKLSPSRLREIHPNIKAAMVVLCDAFKNHRSRAEAWRAFVKVEPDLAKLIDDSGFKAKWLDTNYFPTRDLTPTTLADEALAFMFDSTRLSIQKRRRGGTTKTRTNRK